MGAWGESETNWRKFACFLPRLTTPTRVGNARRRPRQAMPRLARALPLSWWALALALRSCRPSRPPRTRACSRLLDRPPAACAREVAPTTPSLILPPSAPRPSAYPGLRVSRAPSRAVSPAPSPPDPRRTHDGHHPLSLDLLRPPSTIPQPRPYPRHEAASRPIATPLSVPTAPALRSPPISARRPSLVPFQATRCNASRSSLLRTPAPPFQASPVSQRPPRGPRAHPSSPSHLRLLPFLFLSPHTSCLVLPTLRTPARSCGVTALPTGPRRPVKY